MPLWNFVGPWTAREKLGINRVLGGNVRGNPWTLLKSECGTLYSAWRDTWDPASRHGKLSANSFDKLLEKLRQYYKRGSLAV